MARKIKLIKGASYSAKGIRATKKNPEVIVDEAAAEKAVASGFFEYADEADAPAEPSPAVMPEPQDIPFCEPDPDKIAVENMTLAQLKDLASQMGISTKGLKNKAAYIEAIEESAEAHGA